MHSNPKPDPPNQVSSRVVLLHALRHGCKGPQTCTSLSHGSSPQDSKLNHVWISLNGLQQSSLLTTPKMHLAEIRRMRNFVSVYACWGYVLFASQKPLAENNVECTLGAKVWELLLAKRCVCPQVPQASPH